MPEAAVNNQIVSVFSLVIDRSFITQDTHIFLHFRKVLVGLDSFSALSLGSGGLLCAELAKCFRNKRVA
jgi:hypothetical protein